MNNLCVHTTLLEYFRAIDPTLGCQRPCYDTIGKIHNHWMRWMHFFKSESFNQTVSISSVWRRLHQQKAHWKLHDATLKAQFHAASAAYFGHWNIIFHGHNWDNKIEYTVQFHTKTLQRLELTKLRIQGCILKSWHFTRQYNLLTL